MATAGPRARPTAGSSSGSCAPTCGCPRSARCSGARAWRSVTPRCGASPWRSSAGGVPRRRSHSPVLSRYRFVYPVFRETTETAIEACEAAWAFFHGVFRVLIPDNTKTIVQRADPLEPRFTPAFLEYAQARGFVIDPTRVRRPRDKARVERAEPIVRDDCFAGEVLLDLAHARTHAVQWCREDYGVRRHSQTFRPPTRAL